jgi:signal transduction histidine kinase
MAPAESASEMNAAERLAALERRLGELSAEIEAERARSAQLGHAAARDERQRIAQALHDTVCQSLSAASLEAAILSRKLVAKGAEGAAGATALREMIRKAVRELHELVDALQRETGAPAMPDLPRATEGDRNLY